MNTERKSPSPVVIITIGIVTLAVLISIAITWWFYSSFQHLTEENTNNINYVNGTLFASWRESHNCYYIVSVDKNTYNNLVVGKTYDVAVKKTPDSRMYLKYSMELVSKTETENGEYFLILKMVCR